MVMLGGHWSQVIAAAVMVAEIMGSPSDIAGV